MRDYRTLTAPGQMRRLRLLAVRALEHYPIAVERLSPIAHGENTTFLVETRERKAPAGRTPGRYLLRLHRPEYHSLEEIDSELCWLDALSKDLLVPTAIASRSGDRAIGLSVPDVPERFVTVMRWIEGRKMENRTATGLARLGRMGRTLALLHQHAFRWKPPRSFTRRPWGYEQLFGGGGFGIPLRTYVGQRRLAHPVFADIGRAVRRAMSELATFDRAETLIHADLHPRNVVFAGEAANPIDFDDCGRGLILYDVAASLSFIWGTADAPRCLAAFLDGYESVRTLPREQLRHLDTLFAGRRVALTLWSLARERDNPSYRGLADRLARDVQRHWRGA